MDQQSNNAITQLEQELLRILKQEYSFYQSLYLLLDKQRDTIQYNRENSLLDIYTEIERCQKRIKESDERITSLRQRSPRLFKLAAIHPEIKKVVNSISTLVKKSLKLVEENKAYAAEKHDRIRVEIGELRNSTKIMKYLSAPPASAHFVDGTS